MPAGCARGVGRLAEGRTERVGEGVVNPSCGETVLFDLVHEIRGDREKREPAQISPAGLCGVGAEKIRREEQREEHGCEAKARAMAMRDRTS